MVTRPPRLTPRQTQVLLLVAACPDPWEHERIGLALALPSRAGLTVLVSLERRGLVSRAQRYPLESGEAPEGWVATHLGAEAAREAARAVYRRGTWSRWPGDSGCCGR